MSRRIRTKVDRRQADNAHRAWEKRLRRLQADLRAEWRSGHTRPMDTITFIRAAEQWHLRRKHRQERRLLQMRVTAA
jgi:hypothetical protein